MDKDILFGEFLNLEGDGIKIKQIEEKDAEDLFEIYSNENIFKFAPGNPSKNRQTVTNKIKHFDRDFNKKKIIIAGIYYKEKLVGLFEIFDFDYKADMLTLGYRINEKYWNKGIATRSVKIVLEYLFDTVGINRIQAFVLPENKASSKALLNNGFKHEGLIREGQHWSGIGIVSLNLYSVLKSEYQCG